MLTLCGTQPEQADTLVDRLSGVFKAPAEAWLGSKQISFFGAA